MYLLMTAFSRKDFIWLPIYWYFYFSNFTPFFIFVIRLLLIWCSLFEHILAMVKKSGFVKSSLNLIIIYVIIILTEALYTKFCPRTLCILADVSFLQPGT